MLEKCFARVQMGTTDGISFLGAKMARSFLEKKKKKKTSSKKKKKLSSKKKKKNAKSLLICFFFFFLLLKVSRTPAAPGGTAIPGPR